MTGDIHALSGAYAVDALDDIERAQFERHLAECPACTSEVASLREASALLAETTTTTPSAELRERVLAGISTVRPLPPVVSPPAEPEATVVPLEPRRRRRIVTFLAAAAAAVVVGTGGVVWQQHSDQTSPTDQVIQAKDAERFTKTFPGGATATVYRSKQLHEAVVVTHDMPAAPSGHAYALWLQQGDVMKPAGVMPKGSDNEVLLHGDAASAGGVGITVEAAGEEPPTPQGDVVALFSFDT